MSIESSGESIDLDGLTDPACTEIKGIPHSEVLLKFSNAFMAYDPEALALARDQLAKEISPEAMVDTAAIASNFQRMVRIADSTGIPVESMGDDMDAMVEELNEQLGINKYVSAANSKKR
ncbi:MAG: hypothetical protein HN764_16285 [Gammaproteobacteria bacterium]|nr:hypothetical protein [Gammaproteobacteria bacterium]